jgi:peptidyl-prolyl cis-trans isomerase C
MSVVQILREPDPSAAPPPEPLPPKAGRWRKLTRRLRQLAAEPLVHFVLAGIVLFTVGAIYQRQTSIYRIEVTPRHVQQLANDYALQFGARPDPQTLQQIVSRDLQDEMLYRQGRALKLDQGDEIVRRRVIQKMQFLMQDLNPPAEPTTAELQAFYDAHAARYVTPPRASFTHIYFAADAGEAAARTRAAAVLRRLPKGVTRAPERGDAFPDLYDFSAYEPEQVYRLFGHTPFADAVFQAPVSRWIGPYRSGYGWHLIYIAARQPPARPPLAQVRDQVRVDYLQAKQGQANARAFQALARRFTVVRDETAAP